MDETKFQLEMMKSMLQTLGWRFVRCDRQWTAYRGMGEALEYVGELHNVILRAATLTMGGYVKV